MSHLKELLEEYGADYQGTMDRFMGNETLYLRLLDMLFEDENLKKLGNALEAGDQNAAFEAAHTLKGVAANMGLTPLCGRVSALVEPLRAGEKRDDYPELYRALEVEFARADRLRHRIKGGL